MNGVLRLTWRYLRYHRARTVILLTCLTLTFLLPEALLNIRRDRLPKWLPDTQVPLFMAIPIYARRAAM